MKRRLALHALAAATGTSWLASDAMAQSYPSRAVRIIVPWPAGGLVDIAARQLGTRLQAALGQAVVVENKVGAGGNIGAEAIAKAAPDGYTLGVTTSAMTISAAMGGRLGFDVARDFEPLNLVGRVPSVLIVGPAIAPKSVKALVEMAKSRPGKLTYASAGPGSPAHMTGELFKTHQKIFVLHVPYTGAPAALNDQIAGRVDYQFANAAVALPQIRAGRIQALAVTGAQRMEALPQVPTMAEAGVPNFEVDQWLGLLAPKGLPRAVSERLIAEVQKIQDSADFRAALIQAGMSVAAPASATSFAAEIQKDLARWTAVVKTQGIQSE